MSECKLDHTMTDVKNKYIDQQSYLPKDLHAKFDLFSKKNIAKKS